LIGQIIVLHVGPHVSHLFLTHFIHWSMRKVILT